MGAPSTLAEFCAVQHRIRALVAYPRIFDLLKTDTTPEAKYHLNTLALLSLEESQALLKVVAVSPRHCQVLWGVERLTV